MKKSMFIVQIVLWIFFVIISIISLAIAEDPFLKGLDIFIIIVGIINLVISILNFKKMDKKDK
ncbi:MAG: hypothetical protein Q4E28_05180 [Clostridia bacterium]|nr:hypothetical protein [Clostridia bacterium]